MVTVNVGLVNDAETKYFLMPISNVFVLQRVTCGHMNLRLMIVRLIYNILHQPLKIWLKHTEKISLYNKNVL